MSRKKVVLFFPPYTGKTLGPPLGLLSLAAVLERSGWETRLIDGMVEPTYLKQISADIQDAVCFGVSLLTGPMILKAAEASKLVRRLSPRTPIVFGGWHPTLLAEQTLKADYVDAVVRGQGEHSFVEVVERLKSGASLAGVSGVSFRHPAAIIHNPDRAVTDINDLPIPAYHLVDMDKYAKACGIRKTVYASSVGCPYACNYCTDTVFYKRRFNALTVDRVVDEVTELVRRYHLEEVSFLDSNFPVDVKRAVAIARGFLSRGTRFRWTFQASTDLICRMTDNEVKSLAISGVRHIGFGTESAAEEVLGLMNKPHQRVGDMYETARKCSQCGIKITFNLILGYPGETDAHRAETLRTMGHIGQKYPNVRFSPNVFTPYPGITVWKQLGDLGLNEPTSIEQWAQMSLGRNTLPWLQGSQYRRVNRMVSYFMLKQQIQSLTYKKKAMPLRLRLYQASMASLDWRLKHRFFRLPVELWLMHIKKGFVMRRSLLTGRSLGA